LAPLLAARGSQLGELVVGGYDALRAAELGPFAEALGRLVGLEVLELDLRLLDTDAAPAAAVPLAAAVRRLAPRLQRLELRLNFEAQGWLAVLAAVGACGQLRKLRFASADPRHAGRAMGGLAGLTALQALDLSGHALDAAGCALLGQALSTMTALAELSLDCPAEGAHALESGLRALTGLATLDVLENKVAAADEPGQLRDLLDALDASSMRSLRVVGVELDELSCVSMGRLVNLRALTLDECEIDDDDDMLADMLADALRGMTGLQRLDLRIEFDEDDLEPLALAIAQLTTLERMRLSLRTGPSGAAALAAALADLTRLVELDISGNKLEPEGAMTLARAMPLARLAGLVELDVADNRMGSAGTVAAITPALLQLAKLERINLGGNKVGNAVAKALAGIRPDVKLLGVLQH
jgi:hypothetical protein